MFDEATETVLSGSTDNDGCKDDDGPWGGTGLILNSS